MNTQKYLLVIGGPTASGKTGVAIQLAQHFHTEIISADSRQFYREMRIGTAKPSVEELSAAPHHFVDFLSIKEEYSVGDFERDALALLEKLFQKHQLVILSGGSGLYIRALCEGLDQFPEVPAEIRVALQARFQKKGIVPLQEELQQLDPVYYAEVDRNNPQRLMRALEVCRASGQPFSSFRSGQKTERFFRPLYINLSWERSALYQRINRRVDQMMQAGLLAEVRKLLPFQEYNALQTVGYQELFEHFAGKHTLAEAVELIKRNTRRYAKRQLTWLRKRPHWQAFPPDQINEIIAWIESQLHPTEQ